jgi:MFS family permease
MEEILEDKIGLAKFGKLIVPNVTSFVASFCIMVIELVAGRIVARYLGSSVYTWTSVIGVVLAGIAIGNLFGGYIADRFSQKKTLSMLFIFSSAACVIIPILNMKVGQWQLLWYLSWPLRVLLHVALIFFLPSVILGFIGPVVARFALDKGLPKGFTIGNVYAWGAFGSITGTFLTGFYLIAWIGTMKVIWSIAVILALMGVFYSVRLRFSYLWLIILILLILVSYLPLGWSQEMGQWLGLKPKIDREIVYQAESQYYYIEVKNLTDAGSVRELILDQLVHNRVYMDEPSNIYESNQYFYLKLYGALTEFLAKDKKNLSCFFIGGGGYVLPRYIQKHWPVVRLRLRKSIPQLLKQQLRF